MAVSTWVLPWLTYALPIPPWACSAVAITGGMIVGWAFGRPLNILLGTLFGWFNVAFDYATDLYTRAVGVLLISTSTACPYAVRARRRRIKAQRIMGRGSSRSGEGPRTGSEEN